MRDETRAILSGADHEHTEDGERWTVDVGADVVSLTLGWDPECLSPVDPAGTDVAPSLAMIRTHARMDYAGTAPDVDGEGWTPCVACAGDGENLDGVECDACDGRGEVLTEDVGAILAHERDAVASLEIDYGTHREARAVLYFTRAEADRLGEDVERLPEVLETYARELQRWSDGETFYVDVEGPGADGPLHGFIGREYALEEGAEMFADAVREARETLAVRREACIVRGEN